MDQIVTHITFFSNYELEAKAQNTHLIAGGHRHPLMFATPEEFMRCQPWDILKSSKPVITLGLSTLRTQLCCTVRNSIIEQYYTTTTFILLDYRCPVLMLSPVSVRSYHTAACCRVKPDIIWQLLVGMLITCDSLKAAQQFEII